jgi:hypothetical protein
MPNLVTQFVKRPLVGQKATFPEPTPTGASRGAAAGHPKGRSVAKHRAVAGLTERAP